jgi:hypothetical protein
MGPRFLVLLLCTSIILGFALQVESSEIDQQTREMLDAIMAGHRNNRAGLSDFTMSGNILTVRGEGENQVKLETTYKYYELGEKRRIDEAYPEDMGVPIVAGHTKILAFTGKSSLQYYSGHGLYKDSASVNQPHKFHTSSSLTHLDTIAITKSWRSHLGHIQRLLDKTWQPDIQTMDVKTINRQGEALLQVTYKSTGRIEYVYTVDPQRGYEVSQVEHKNAYETGKPYKKKVAKYQISEVLPGIWRATGAKLVFDHWDKDGKHTHVTKQIDSNDVSANTGSINDEFFTLRGMGVRPGSLVQDRTLKPPLRYTYDGPRLRELEDLLEKTGVSSERSSPNVGSEQEQMRAPKEEISQEARKEPVGIKDANFSRPGNKGNKKTSTILWVLVILVISGLLGFTLRKSKRPVSGDKTLQITLFVFLSLLIWSQAKSAEDEISSDPLLVNKELGLYQREGNLCGVTSIYHALWEIGYKVSLKDILSNVPVREKGTSLSAICEYLDKCKVPYHTVKTNTAETILPTLKSKKSVAILYVDNESHFIIAKKTIEGHVVALDGTSVITENTVDKLNSRFSGIALIVGLGPVDTMRHFVAWKRIIAIIGVIPLGIGIGALVKTCCLRHK